MISFMTGDKVRLIDNFRTRGDHKKHPEYYPEPGTVGTPPPMERHWLNGRKLPFEAQEVTGGRIPLILNVSKTRHPITTSGLRLPARKGQR